MAFSDIPQALYNFGKRGIENIDYLLRDLLNPTSETGTFPSGFVLPFTGGQSVGVNYRFQVKVTFSDGSTGFSINSGGALRIEQYTVAEINSVGSVITGAIGGVSFVRGQSNGKFAVIESNPPIEFFVSSKDFGTNPPNTIEIIQLIRADGNADTGGNLPDPNPIGNASSSGLASNEPVDISEAIVLAPAIPLAGFLASVLGALAGLATADNIAALGNALKNLLENLLDKLDNEDEDKEAAKEISRIDLGLLRGDGYKNLYGFDNTTNYEAFLLDLQIFQVPIGTGRFFGINSPNRFRFNQLGYIAFTSNTFGIMETREIEFNRVSFVIPEGAVGFFYHLGLDRKIGANCSIYYEREVKE